VRACHCGAWQGEGKRGLRRSAAGAERVELSRRLQAPARARPAARGRGRGGRGGAPEGDERAVIAVDSVMSGR